MTTKVDAQHALETVVGKALRDRLADSGTVIVGTHTEIADVAVAALAEPQVRRLLSRFLIELYGTEIADFIVRAERLLSEARDAAGEGL
jgi:hypothetical protein